MLTKRKLRKTARQLAEIGSVVDTTFEVYINNDEPRNYPDYESAVAAIKEYRDANVIFSLKVYRINIFSL